MSILDVRLDFPLPESLPAGCRTAVFVIGSCFHRDVDVDSVEVIAGGSATPATAQGMPRLDVYRALHPILGENGAAPDRDPDSADDPELKSYRSGFWATIPIQVPASGGLEVSIRARLTDGTVTEARLGEVRTATPPEPEGSTATSTPTVAIVMATYDPGRELLEAQIESIRNQTISDWTCLISDDCSPPEAIERIRDVIGDDPRFRLLTSRRRVGFYLNFERALGRVPSDAPFVALADQDDRWDPDKLEVLLARIGDAKLVYSDQRVVDVGGALQADTYWTARRNNYTSLASLLIANTITGAASLFRRELLDFALPFPRPPGAQYHDQWLGLVALATGRIEYVDRPLYDYVQHGGAALGHQGGGTAAESLRDRLPSIAAAARRREWRRLVAGWRTSYFFAYCRLRLLAEVLLERCGDQLGRRSRRMLRRFAHAERSPAGFAWLLARRARRWGHQSETMGAEGLIARGILWRHVVAGAAMRRRRPVSGKGFIAGLPSGSTEPRVTSVEHEASRILGGMIEPLSLSVVAEAPERVNLLVPTIELKHFFGGYITKFNLARKLAEHGVRTRILTVDPTEPLPRDWRGQVEAYAGLGGLFEQVEVAFARDRDAPVEVSPDDAFIATTWWTAHIARAALGSVRRSRFLYLIQEYEPFTFPMGSWSAMAASTYGFPHVAMFSTEYLREFFAAHGYGVYADGPEQGAQRSLSFQNAITAVPRPTVEELGARRARQLLFYARPEAHGARNMFELGVLAIAGAVDAGILDAEWELHGIGSVEGRDRIGVAPGRYVDVLPKRAQAGYADLLRDHDVGLALMSTPHPSLVPLEMASAGMLTVTNTFETKTRERMSALAGNLLAVPPTLDGVIEGLAEAVGRVDDLDSRVTGSELDWSRDWDQSLNPSVMARVIELLRDT